MTFLLALMMMLGLFLLLWAGVGFIQNKKFFSSCPREVYDRIQAKEKRFNGQYVFGWGLAIFALLLMGAALLIGVENGIQSGFSFGQFFIRFLSMLLLLKVFDILFFDWFLLSKRGLGFFEKYYPEVAELLSSSLFGYNKREHLIQTITIVLASLLAAWICTLF
ncbi:MAG: hypothetical protein Q4P72_04150 [Eubacteriales bacterium]|nr:hypothetical protein [Eubacteriales bacterium]